MHRNKSRQPCILGMDPGSHSAKMTLAYRRTPNERVIVRVPIPTRANTERSRSAAADKSLFQFMAFAALGDDGRLIYGRQSLNKDRTFPIKTIYTYRAISRHETVEALPAGKALLRAISDNLVTDDQLDTCLREHYEFLHNAATACANSNQLYIETLVLTHPNYLGRAEHEDDFLKWKEYYFYFLFPLWPMDDLKFEMVSEGQAAALYVCELFNDPGIGNTRQELWAALTELDITDGLRLVIPDNGASTLNIQTQTVYFTEDGDIKSSQSYFQSSWNTGAIGGSHFSNSLIEESIRNDIRRRYNPEDIAFMLQNFEQEKYHLDWTDNSKSIELYTRNHVGSYRIVPQMIKATFDQAFGAGLQVVQTEVRRIAKLGRDFAVVFCGGSYCNESLRDYVGRLLDEIAEEHINVKIKHLFLWDFDHVWASAVSAGAAISGLDIPPPRRLLASSSIAIQKVTKPKPDAVDWEGQCCASILFRKGCGTSLPSPQYYNGSRSRYLTRFRLICQPLEDIRLNDDSSASQINIADRVVRDGQRAGEPSITSMTTRDGGHRAQEIMISGYDNNHETPNTKPGYYPFDLGWEILATDLCRGTICFSVEDKDGTINQLMLGQELSDIDSMKPIEFFILCYKLNKGKRYDRHQKRWQITLKSEPSSKSLAVDDVLDMSSHCIGCGQDLNETIRHRCRTCVAFNFCQDCFFESPYDHDDTHTFDVVNS